MLILPSWFTSSVSRLARAVSAGRLLAAAAATFFAVNASAQTIQLTSSAYTVNENDGSIRIAVRRTGDANSTATVRIAATPGSAIDGQDFVARAATLTFPTNSTEQFFDVVILDNAVTNAAKTINLVLSNPTGGSIVFPSAATITILDDETGAQGFSTGFFEFSARIYSVTDSEGTVRAENAGSYQGANITIVRKGGSRGRVLIDFAIGGGTAYTNVFYPAMSNVTVALDDYQMSTNILVPIWKYTNYVSDLNYNSCYGTNDTGQITNNCDFSVVPPGNHVWPFGVILTSDGQSCFRPFFFPTTNSGLFGFRSSPTWFANMSISNPRLDPAEDQSLPPPSLGTTASAQLSVIHVDAGVTQSGSGGLGGRVSNLGYAIERGHYRAAEGGNGNPNGRSLGAYQIFVNRDQCPDSALVRYWVNNLNSGASGGDHQYRAFQTEAGSDYATPFFDYIPPGTKEWWVAIGQADKDGDATVSWGITERDPKPLTIPIVPDDRVEFDEDMQVQLYQRAGDVGQIEFGADTANLTITFDRIRYIGGDPIFHVAYDTNGVFGAEQPAGAVDRRYNRNGDNDIDPPFNPFPGANASVLAVAVQPDGKLVLGGEFEAINTRKNPWVYHLGRMTRDGQVDTNFVVGTGPNGAVSAIDIQPDGKIVIGGLFSSYNGQLRHGIARVDTNGVLDASFNPGLGADAPVRAIKIQADGKILVGGEFTTFNGTSVNYLARLNPNGTLDTSFNQGGSGPDDFVYSIAVSADPTIIDLRSLDLDQRRDRSDTYDTGSNEGTILLDYNLGGSRTSQSLRVYYNGQIIADTGQTNGQGSLTINYGPGPIDQTQINVRLNEDFVGLFTDTAGWQYHMTILPKLDSLPVVGGRFTHFNGVPRNRLARLLPTGSLDTQFDIGSGIEDGIAFAVAKHGNKVLAGGAFTTVNRFSRNSIVQFNTSGSVDTSFDPGSGFNDIVFSLVVQPTGKPVAGGLFTEFNTSRRVGMARLNHDGKLDSSFMDTAYNQFAGIPNPYTWMPENSINAMVNLRVTNIYTFIINYTNSDNIATNLTVNMPRIEDQLFVGGSFDTIGGGFTRDGKLPRRNFARVWGGSTPGPGTVGFQTDQYFGDENSGGVFIVMNRDFGHLIGTSGSVTSSDLPQGAGAATAGIDYSPIQQTVSWPNARNYSRMVSEALRGPNSQEFFTTDEDPGPTSGLDSRTNNVLSSLSPIVVPIIDDTQQEGDEQLQLNFAVNQQFVSLGGVSIPTWPSLGRSTARLTIVDDDFSPGVITFEQPQYFVDENGGKARITLIRTNGVAGRVTVDVRTRSQGFTATPGVDYTAITLQTIVFAAGQTNAYFDVPIIDDTTAELDETIGLALSNPTGGATIGSAASTLTIIDNDFAAGRLQFSAATNVVNEGAGVVNVVVRRSGGSVGVSQVTVSTADGTAIAGQDYTPVNTVLTWQSGETTDKIVSIPIVDREVIDGARTFQVVLSNPIVKGSPEPNALGNQKTTAVQIIDNDAFGNLRFSQPAYTVDENGTNAVISVIRVNGVVGTLNVDYSAVAETAITNQDFVPVTGTLVFTNHQISASFVVPIIDDSVVDGTKTVRLNLSNQLNIQGSVTNAGVLSFPSTNVLLNIVDNELENIPAGSLDVTFQAEGANDFIYALSLQDDGRLMIGGNFTSVNNVLRNRLARLNADGTLDSSFFAGAGPDDSVRAVQVQQDGRVLIAGVFQNVGATARHYIARLVTDGGIDLTFDPGAGANNPIFTMLLLPDKKILIGGEFSAYGPITRNGIARLNPDGSLDASFNPGTGAAGSTTFTVFTIAQQLDGKILVGGDFEMFNNIPARHLVRLNPDGSVDSSFNTSVGADASVRSIFVQPDGEILVGGMFTTMQGAAANHIARLNPDGTIDSTFNVASSIAAAKRGANGPVLAINVQTDGKIMLGGDFTEYNGVTRRGLTRLNVDGSNDPTINFGTGVNGSVVALAIQPDRRIILAGGFTEYDGQPRLGLARIHGGSIAGFGRVEFSRALYTASESGTNVVINVRRTGGTSGQISMNFSTQPDATVSADAAATAGQDYTPVSGTVVFPEGETQASFKVPIANDTLVENDEIFDVVLTDPNGDTSRIGDQPSARVVIISDDSEIYFTAPAYSVSENTPAGNVAITIARAGSTSVTAAADFTTVDGTATAGADYTGVTNRVTFAVGESVRTVFVPITDDQLVEGNEYFTVKISNTSSNATARVGSDNSRVTIVDDDRAPGQLAFERASYNVREGNVLAEVSVIRTNGLSGVVTVQYATSAGTATPGSDYLDKSGILTFNDGEAQKFIEIQIQDDNAVENNETVNLTLSNPSGGASLGLSSATLTIIDDDLGSGSIDTSFNPGVGANGPIRALLYDGNNHYLIGGDFTAYNNDSFRGRMTRIQINGPLDTTFSTNHWPNNSVASLALQADGNIVMGGSFRAVQDQVENRVARVLSSGVLDTSFNLPLGLDAQVSSIAVQPDGRIVIGGVFDQASAATFNHIARLLSNGNVDISFDPGSGADDNVNVVALEGDKILIGGAFGTVNGIGAGRIARLNADGSIDLSFRTGTGFSRADGRRPMVYDILVLPSGRILVVGDFTSYNGTPRQGIAMLDASGTLQSFGSSLLSVNGAIRTVALQHTDRNSDEKILIGGDFTAVDATPRARIARLDATGRFDPSFDAGDGANDSVFDIFVQPWDGRVVVVGAFTQFNNNPNLHGIARMNNDKVFLPPTGPISVTSATIASGSLRITFAGDVGTTYTIEGSTDLVNWVDVKTVAGAGATTSTDIPATGNYRFFRIRR